jgi:hypothetical protein
MSDVFKKGAVADTEISEPLQSTKKMGYSAQLDKESRLNPFKLPITGSHQSIKRINVEMKLVD